MAVDRRGKGMGQHLKRIVHAPIESHDLLQVFGYNLMSHFFGENNDVIGQQDGAESSAGVASLLEGKAAVVPDYLDPVTRLSRGRREDHSHIQTLWNP